MTSPPDVVTESAAANDRHGSASEQGFVSRPVLATNVRCTPTASAGNEAADRMAATTDVNTRTADLLMATSNVGKTEPAPGHQGVTVHPSIHAAKARVKSRESIADRSLE